MNRLFGAVSTLLFPNRCAFCGDVTAGKKLCCQKCDKRLRRFGDDAVQVVGGMTVYSCFYYKEQCREKLDCFKFNGEKERADYFADEMSKLIVERTGGFDFDHVAYLPMPELRERSRGYNQGKLLAAAVAARHGKSCESCGLTRDEPFAQHDLNAAMRRKQNYGSFQIIDGTQLCGSVLLVDDVTTTGSSLVGCAQLLRRAGADNITAITVAR